MDNKWLQELLRSILRDIDIRRLMHMLIIFVILTVLLPDSVKQSVGAHNPEFLPAFSLYYLMILCVSFFISSLTSFTTKSLFNALHTLALRIRVITLSEPEKQCLLSFNHNPVVEQLVYKGILRKTYSLNCGPDMEGYVIEDKYHFHVLRHLSASL
ncbi:superinfection exclusion B family protein [Citrobacter freundii]|nr:superinfection exclusion B family protein [Citrobacter freundii]